jgi:arabinose-5-phosphate isomerase
MDDLLLAGRSIIQKEGEALLSFVGTLNESFSSVCRQIMSCKGTVLLTGMGKSGLIARKWASTFLSTGTRSYFINPAEASHGDLGIIRTGDILIALSYSGETDELSSVLRYARENEIPIIGVTGNIESSLAKQSSQVLSVYLSEEACPLGLAPTTSTTVMMALGDGLAMTLMQMRGFTEKDFARLHPGGSLGRKLWLRVTELMHSGEALPLVEPDAKLEDVLVVMTQKRLGAAIVVKGDEILGVVTDGDLRRLFQKGKMSADLTAQQIMTRDPKRLPANALAVEARELMEKNLIQQLLIVDNMGKLVGILHLHDLLRKKVV